MVNGHTGLLATIGRFPRPNIMFNIFNLRHIDLN